MTATLEIDSPTAKTILPPTPPDFLRVWYAACPADQFLELRALRPGVHPIQDFFTLDTIPALYWRACELVEQFDVYFGVCPRIRPRGDTASVTREPGLWADLDFRRLPDGEAGALRKLAEVSLAPLVDRGHGWRLASVLAPPGGGPGGRGIRRPAERHRPRLGRRPRGDGSEPAAPDPWHLQ